MNLPHKQSGFGLIEVLIAMLVLSVSLMAIASLQARSLQFNQSAYWRSQANILAGDVFERLRAVRNGFDAAEGNAVITAWADSVEELIPGGEGTVVCNSLGNPGIVLCTVSVRWTETNIFGEVDVDELDGEARTTFTYVSSL